MQTPKFNKFYITEILNDLFRHGFVQQGKADELLRAWAAELREDARPQVSASRLRRAFNAEIGKWNW